MSKAGVGGVRVGVPVGVGPEMNTRAIWRRKKD